MSKTASLSYVPAIHKGYVNFLKQYNVPFFVLGTEFIAAVPTLDRDVRAMTSEDVAAALGAIRVSPSVEVLSSANIDAFKQKFDHLIMPDDAANHFFAEKYLDQDMTVEYIPTFLRWDMKASLQLVPVEESDASSAQAEELEIMKAIKQEAQKSPDWWRQVGAMIITSRGERIMTHNTHMPSADYSLNTFGDPRSNFNAGERIDLSKAIHAEAMAISQAAKSGQALEGASIYVSTFPCPQCAKLVAESGIKHAIYDEGYSLLDAQDTLKAYGVSLRRLSI